MSIDISNPLQTVTDALSALLTPWSQASRLLKLTTPLGADTLLVECFTGQEGLSQGYKFEIMALSTDAHLELKALTGQPVLLELLTAHSRTDLRPFHGHITKIKAVGANGGLARYRLILEPWTAFLAARRDATTYQDMTVFAIIESVFKRYEGHGALVPAWRLDIADPSIYPQRSLTTQYQETDLAFVERLMNEEGLFYFYEHQGDALSPTRGRHTLVIADHNGSCQASCRLNT
jgi:Rhs element Vgr protein